MFTKAAIVVALAGTVNAALSINTPVCLLPFFRNYISSADNYYFRLLSLNASQPLFLGPAALPLLTILPSFLVAKSLPLL